MSEHRTIHDPFLGKDVQISDNLTDRLRGKYANGPMMPNGEPEFGWHQFDTPPLQHLAADRIDALVKALEDVVRDINDYERANNLAPNPGRAECWDSVARAKATLASIKEPA